MTASNHLEIQLYISKTPPARERSFLAIGKGAVSCCWNWDFSDLPSRLFGAAVMFPPPHRLVQVPVPLLPGIGLVHHHFVILYFTTYNKYPCMSASHDVVGTGGIYVQPLLEPGRDFSSEERAMLQHLQLGGVQIEVRDGGGGGVLPQDSDFHCCRGWKKSCEFYLLFIALTNSTHRASPRLLCCLCNVGRYLSELL